MLKTVLAACALLCALTINAEARQRHRTPGLEQSCIPTGDTMRPCAYQPNFLAGVKSIRVQMRKEITPKANSRRRKLRVLIPEEITHRDTFAGYSIAKPARYIAGRLICAVNVGVALAERGIKGTGSALALSYLKWGRSAGGPVTGAVIVSARRGGGHVAIVSRVENGVVYAWNATGGQRGWREIPYRHRVIDYRVPG